MPLGDAVTLAGVRDCGLDYGRVRVWGSLTFIIAALGSGAALADVAPATLGGNAVLLLVLATSAVLLAACLAIPQTDRPRAPIGTRRVALARLVGDRRFWLLVVSAAALQASHQLYYGFGTLYWRELGFSDAVIGAMWISSLWDVERLELPRARIRIATIVTTPPPPPPPAGRRPDPPGSSTAPNTSTPTTRPPGSRSFGP